MTGDLAGPLCQADRFAAVSDGWLRMSGQDPRQVVKRGSPFWLQPQHLAIMRHGFRAPSEGGQGLR